MALVTNSIRDISAGGYNCYSNVLPEINLPSTSGLDCSILCVTVSCPFPYNFSIYMW